MGRQHSQRYSSSSFADELYDLLGSAKRCLAELKADLHSMPTGRAPVAAGQSVARASQEAAAVRPDLPAGATADQLQLEVERLRQLLAVSHNDCIPDSTGRWTQEPSGTLGISSSSSRATGLDAQDRLHTPIFGAGKLWETCGAPVDASNDCVSPADQTLCRATTSSPAWHDEGTSASAARGCDAGAHGRSIMPGPAVSRSVSGLPKDYLLTGMLGNLPAPQADAAAAASISSMLGSWAKAPHAAAVVEAHHPGDDSAYDQDMPYHCVQTASNWEAVHVGHVHPPQILRVHVSPHDHDPISCAEVYEGCTEGAAQASWTSPPGTASPVSSTCLSHTDLSCSSEDLQTSSMSLVDDLLRDLRQTIHDGVLWHEAQPA